MQKNSLTDLFSVEDQKIAIDQSKILIFDGTNVAFRCVFSSVFMDPEDNDKFYFFRHLFVNSILQTIQKFNPEKVILAFDVRKSWRKKIYEGYKARRKLARDKAVIDFDKFYPVFNEFKEDLINTFRTIYTLEIDDCEADDIIAILTKEKFKDKHVIIVSTDKDLHQLLTNPNVQQYDPINKKMVRCVNPKKELDIKLLTGDKGDDIPPIKPRVGPATAEKIMKAGLEDYLHQKEHKEIYQNYVRNRTLIDFDFIPVDVSRKILNTYCEYQIQEIPKDKLMKFFTKHRLLRLMSDWQGYADHIKNLR